MEALVPEEAVAIAAGDRHSLAVGASGRVWAWGAGGGAGAAPGGGDDATWPPARLPRLVPGIASAESVAAGSAHSLILCRDDSWGVVYSWGDGSRGALGHAEGAASATGSGFLSFFFSSSSSSRRKGDRGRAAAERAAPRLLRTLAGYDVRAISASGSRSGGRRRGRGRRKRERRSSPRLGRRRRLPRRGLGRWARGARLPRAGPGPPPRRRRFPLRRVSAGPREVARARRAGGRDAPALVGRRRRPRRPRADRGASGPLLLRRRRLLSSSVSPASASDGGRQAPPRDGTRRTGSDTVGLCGVEAQSRVLRGLRRRRVRPPERRRSPFFFPGLGPLASASPFPLLLGLGRVAGLRGPPGSLGHEHRRRAARRRGRPGQAAALCRLGARPGGVGERRRRRRRPGRRAGRTRTGGPTRFFVFASLPPEPLEGTAGLCGAQPQRRAGRGGAGRAVESVNN